ncbi:asparagine synthase (glutamine-hydrolyzing) [Gorillibacterium sp. CAU 1737]|uniref:asparagine synthase (glutamine-hydrolyzing) n=1 Tax=Gorillibacterium sp. CAU 1737 TaxID=3140362 RepID=UPI0032614092
MCGITGMMLFNGLAPSRETLQRMTDVIAHRGPNDSGFLTDKGVGLGFRRLSIIDIREGHQPLSNEDESVWIIFNGEIYNYKELRAMLIDRGHVFRTASDTETIVHLYEEFGEDCVAMLRGMFGFAIWDQKKRKLLAARDHFGIKPFYYHHTSERFVFGSEIKSLLEAEGMERSVRPESLLNYLTFQYVPEPDTMFAGIQKLRPGHYLTMTEDGRMAVKRYYDPMFAPEDRPFEDYVEEIRERLKSSVEHHLVSDVERGCFLSSGIDSTAMAAHMSMFESIQTFSVGFEGANNETIIAAETAKALGTQHYAKIITEKDYFDCLPKAAWHQDEPVADPSAIALYHLAELARQHVTVVLSGEGADELFGGYRIYREPLSLKPLSWLPGPLQRALHQLAQLLPGGFTGRNYLLRATTPLEERFLGNAKIFSEDMKASVLASHADLLGTYKNPIQIAGDYYSKTRHLDPVSRMQYIDMNLWMPGDILMKADKMTMAHSLELRVPFLDKEVFDVARRIPMKYRLANGTTKHIFRKAMEGIIPDFILDRPKLGFPVPMRDWMKGPRGTQVLEQIEAGGIGNFIRFSAVEEMLAKHRKGEGDYARRLWTIYMFALWHETYLLPGKGTQGGNRDTVYREAL